jgi:hypothetical protein
MPAMSTKPPEPAETESKLLPSPGTSAQTVIAWSGFMFALLQSVCTFFTALDGLRLLIGAGALAAVIQAGAFWDHFHANWIRVPMVVLAFVGSLLNLLILRRIWRLRNHPAAHWRRVPVSPRKIRMERVQFALAVITLALVSIEEVTHFRTFHRF